ncbi:MAG TPA: hypothetical protein VGT99_08635 [Gammaproteobacteria bacterium]|nr:hypothetical protein [Gammaproteobacteria bacterium]
MPARLPLRAAILAALSAAPVLQAATVPPGSALDASEFLVNTHTGGNQINPVVARDAAGDFVVVWGSFDQASSTSSYDIYGQRYSAAGQAQGSEFLVNTFTGGPQRSPAVAMDAAGDFVVAWQSNNQAGVTSGYDIYARQYNAGGTALHSSEFLVNTFTTGNQFIPSVAMDAGGDFVVAWASLNQAGATSGDDIYARQYNAGGTALQSNEFLVNTFTSGVQLNPSVAMDAAGDFVVAWQSNNQASGTSGYDIYARQFTSAGTAVQANEFLVNTFTTGGQQNSSVAMDAAGDFVVSWASYGQTAVGSGDIYARQYNAAGTALQISEFQVNTASTHSGFVYELPKVAMDAAGDFVVAFYDYTNVSSNSYDVFARQYTAAGSAVQTSEFLVNTFTSGNQETPAVAMDAAGDFVVAWESYDQASSTSAYDIYARRYQGPESVDLKTTLAASPSSVNTSGSFALTLGVNNKTAASSISNTTIAANLGNASGIAAVFTVPSGATLGTTSGSNWSCGTISGGSLSCSYTGSLAAATAAQALTLNFTAPSSAGMLAFPVSVSATEQQSGSDSSGDSASTTVTVNAASTGGGGGGGGGYGGGGGSFGLLSLAFLGLPLLRRRRPRH